MYPWRVRRNDERSSSGSFTSRLYVDRATDRRCHCWTSSQPNAPRYSASARSFATSDLSEQPSSNRYCPSSISSIAGYFATWLFGVATLARVPASQKLCLVSTHPAVRRAKQLKQQNRFRFPVRPSSKRVGRNRRSATLPMPNGDFSNTNSRRSKRLRWAFWPADYDSQQHQQRCIRLRRTISVS